MKQCKNCIFFNEQYNDLHIEFEDVHTSDAYCPMFEMGIPKDITTDNKKCSHFISMNEE